MLDLIVLLAAWAAIIWFIVWGWRKLRKHFDKTRHE